MEVSPNVIYSVKSYTLDGPVISICLISFYERY